MRDADYIGGSYYLCLVNNSDSEEDLREWSEEDYFTGGGQTPLMVAASNGNINAVEALIAAGCNVNAATVARGSRSPQDSTALQLAAMGVGTGDEDEPYNPGNLPAVINALIAAGAEGAAEALVLARERNADQAVLAALQAAVSAKNKP